MVNKNSQNQGKGQYDQSIKGGQGEEFTAESPQVDQEAEVEFIPDQKLENKIEE